MINEKYKIKYLHKVSFITSLDFYSSNKAHFKVVFSLIYSVLSIRK